MRGSRQSGESGPTAAAISPGEGPSTAQRLVAAGNCSIHGHGQGTRNSVRVALSWQ